MAFGTPSNEISVQTSNKVEAAKKLNGVGEILEYTTHGGENTKTEEVYADSISNEAVNGQVGTSVKTEHGLNQVNSDYAKSSKTTLTALATATTTTTTTT